MILTIRTWDVDRANHAEFARISEDEFWPEFEGLEGRPLGLWVSRVGGPERVVLMTTYASLEHWLATRSWGPANARLKELNDRRARLARDTDLLALLPLSSRQPQANAPESSPGFYIRERFRLAAPDAERFRAMTEDEWLPWAEQGGRLRLVGCWLSYVGPGECVEMLTRVEAMSDWDARCFAGGAEGAALPAGVERARRALAERRAFAPPLTSEILMPITRRRP